MRVAFLLALFAPMIAVGDVDYRAYLPNLHADAGVLAEDLHVSRFGPDNALLYYGFGGANYGPGHLIVLGLREGAEPVMPAHQVVYRSDGSLEMLPGSAGRFIFHQAHNHWHYENYAKVTLVNLADASRRTARKQSFCLVDVRSVPTTYSNPPGQPATLPASFTLNGVEYTIDCGRGDVNAQFTAQGISAGKMDIYDSGLNDPISIEGDSNIDGWYKLIATTNPDGGIQETYTEDDWSVVYLKLQGDQVIVDHRLLGGSDCKVEPFPNPMRPSGINRFVARGKTIQSLRIEIYDLKGQRVIDSGEVPGNQFIWNLRNDRGDPVASGSYMYVGTLRGELGDVFRTEPKVVMVLR